MNDFPFMEKMKKIHHKILEFVSDEQNTNEQIEELIYFFKDEQIEKNRNVFKMFLFLISKIANNHFRDSIFIFKIEQILKNYFDIIQKNFTNDEIFHIFKHNKLLLLFFIENDIFQIDDNIYSIISKGYYYSAKYPEYFYNSIKTLSTFQIEEIPEDSKEKRRIGENDSKICELIRNDRIDEFIVYINQNSISLNSTISTSIFETNPLLLKKRPNLIEYSVFYGSIQIFRYLQINKVKLEPSLWIYAIHSNNAELIYILENESVLPKDESYKECLFESIKCHHNDIANYILNNLINDKENINELTKKLISKSFRYHNYFFIPDKLDQIIFFFFASEFNYLNIVEYFLNTKKVDIDLELITIKLFNKIYKKYLYKISYIISLWSFI